MQSVACFCKKASDILERLCLMGAGALLIINLLDVMLGVFGRFFRPPMWTTDLAKITLVWMIMLAAAPALKRGEHMAIRIVVDRLPKTQRQVIAVLRGLVFSGILMFMVFYGYNYAYKLHLFTIMTLGIKKSIPLMSIPVGMGLMLIQYTLQQFIPMVGDAHSVGEDAS
ncbi:MULTISPECIES: TRAP transporter small permease [unclassified Pseudodesulfovibrio]|uniref:TRAP transporter small permease n=1 Tax=unclassified Pseudodesulfovibrio TaxID=2661612 RepID=UPI000FEB844F|nr:MULTISPECIES: TRAP transporter small permease [unclassified Pseudodesulfovibrio]MCJ2163416.1 TRAP transporter small permease [Pseudodesulfovibrio sp. S3-i]RWU06653.1 TRAP transporter small permease [Pseudodesulfovibrio sp. S3]